MVTVDFSKISNVVFDGIDHRDYPDYSDVYILSCEIDGKEATEEELEIINDDYDFVYETLMDYLH